MASETHTSSCVTLAKLFDPVQWGVLFNARSSFIYAAYSYTINILNMSALIQLQLMNLQKIVIQLVTYLILLVTPFIQQHFQVARVVVVNKILPHSRLHSIRSIIRLNFKSIF
jgi:hypothetical protein